MYKQVRADVVSVLRLCCRLLLSILVACVVVLSAGCSEEDVSCWVILRMDGEEQVIRTEAVTVRGLLSENEITLGTYDQVSPGLLYELVAGMIVTVTRIEEQREQLPIPFPRNVLRDESRLPGEMKIIREGRDGEEELVYHVILENGKEISRSLVEHRVISEPTPEIMIVGIKGMLPATTFPGFIAYISGGNAWVIDGRNGEKRPLTFDGDLDARLFSFSSDARRLAFSRWSDDRHLLNSLWVLDTRLIDEPPILARDVSSVYVEWLPSSEQFMYSTAMRTEGAPGWRANNDLWQYSLADGESEQLLPASTNSLYSWWGRTYALSPDGENVVYAGADEIGIVHIATGTVEVVLKFAPYHTYAEWVWTPTVAWSPDGRYLVTNVHVASEDTDTLEDSSQFDLWLIDLQTGVDTRILSSVGMWAMPSWSPDPNRLNDGNVAEIAFLQARRPKTSDESPYDLYVTDQTGTYIRQVFSVGSTDELTVPRFAWSPLGNELVVELDGDLYLVDLTESVPRQLTADGLSGNPQWVIPAQ